MKERKEKTKTIGERRRGNLTKNFVQDFEYLDSLGTGAPGRSCSLNVTEIQEEMGKITAIRALQASPACIP